MSGKSYPLLELIRYYTLVLAFLCIPQPFSRTIVSYSYLAVCSALGCTSRSTRFKVVLSTLAWCHSPCTSNPPALDYPQRGPISAPTLARKPLLHSGIAIAHVDRLCRSPQTRMWIHMATQASDLNSQTPPHVPG